MITVFASAGRGLNARTTEVRLQGHDTLTPAAARAACHVAFGNTAGPYDVTDGQGKAYHISQSGEVRAVPVYGADEL